MPILVFVERVMEGVNGGEEGVEKGKARLVKGQSFGEAID